MLKCERRTTAVRAKSISGQRNDPGNLGCRPRMAPPCRCDDSPIHDPAAAKRVALHNLLREYLLLVNPKLRAPGRVPGTRELVIPKTPYVVHYRVRGTKIEITRVYHTSRRWPDRCSASDTTPPAPSSPRQQPRNFGIGCGARATTKYSESYIVRSGAPSPTIRRRRDCTSSLWSSAGSDL
jgi:toxin ParE1/3/4